MAKHSQHQFTFMFSDEADNLGFGKERSTAEIRTWGDKWVADAHLVSNSVGDQESADAARSMLIKKLRELADIIEREW